MRVAAGPEEVDVHASAVAVGPAGPGVLIVGASGRGKSALALNLIALGACLVGDDRIRLRREGDRIVMRPHEALNGLIEARGVGLLHAATRPSAPLDLIIDLDLPETERLPPRRHRHLLDLEIALLHGVDSNCFPAAVMQYLRGGRVDPA